MTRGRAHIDLITDEERAIEVIEAAFQAIEKGEGIFKDGVYRPEEKFVELVTVASEEEFLNDDALPCNAMFLVSSLVRGGSTKVLFEHLTDLKLFKEYWWVFDPWEVVQTDEAYLIEALKTYIRPGGFQGKSFHDWMHNCQRMVDLYDGDIRNFFRFYENDAEQILSDLVVAPRAKNKTGFRAFGIKLSALAVQWINQYGLYQFEKMHKVPVPVDFIVGSISFQTGILLTKLDEVTAHWVTGVYLPELFLKLAEERGWNSRKISEALWSIGVLGCQKEAHLDCPLRDFCQFMISRRPMDKGGKFSIVTAKDWRSEIGYTGGS